MSSSLVNLYSHNFGGENVIEVSLVQDNDVELKPWQESVFCFIKMVPSSTGADGKRTLDVNNKIVVKASLNDVSGLSMSIKYLCQGRGDYGRYSINSNKKYVWSIGYLNDKKEPRICLNFKDGSNPEIKNDYNPSQAMSISTVLDLIVKKGLDYAFDKNKMFGNGVQQIKTAPQGNVNTPPPPGNAPLVEKLSVFDNPFN